VECASATSAASPAHTQTDASPPPAPDCGDYDSCVRSGRSKFELSQWQDALGQFQAASQLDASKGAAWVGIGDAYFQRGQYDDAAKAWDKALVLGSVLSAPVCHWGLTCNDTGSFQLSMKEVSFFNKKGETEIIGAPSAVTFVGPSQNPGQQLAYYFFIKSKKNWRFNYSPRSLQCTNNFACPDPGPTQQRMYAQYLSTTLNKLKTGELRAQP